MIPVITKAPTGYHGLKAVMCPSGIADQSEHLLIFIPVKVIVSMSKGFQTLNKPLASKSMNTLSATYQHQSTQTLNQKTVMRCALSYLSICLCTAYTCYLMLATYRVDPGLNPQRQF